MSIGTARGAGLMIIAGIAGATVRLNIADPADDMTVKLAAPSGAAADALSMKVICVAVSCTPLSDSAALGGVTVTPNRFVPVTVTSLVSPRLMLFGDTILTVGPGVVAVTRLTSRMLPTAS